MYKVLDLFSGAGGFSYGLEMNKKFKIKIALDFNEKALRTYKYNHPDAKIINGDITNQLIKSQIIQLAQEDNVNMIIGGPPCQGFSLKGKKLGISDHRNFLFLEFFDVVKNIDPEIFIMENVPAIINSSNGFFINEIINKFESIDYKINYEVLNASDFGVPQNRKRTFIIGSKIKKMKMPIPDIKLKNNVRDAISDLSYLDSGDIEFKREYLLKPKSNFQINMRKDSKYLFNHSATNHTKETIYKLNLIPINGTKFNLPIHLRTNQKFKTTWSRLRWNELSPTIDTRFDTPSNGRNTHPFLNRSITLREAARLQSFPDRFVFLGNKTSICRQIGNAVPPLLAFALANSIEKQSLVIPRKNIKNISGEDFQIILGDSYKLSKIFENNKFDAIITDPPYNISKKNNFSTMRHKRKGIDFGEWDKNFDLFSWIELYNDKLKPGGSYIIFCSYIYISHIIDKLNSLGVVVKDVLKWIKSNPMPRNVDRRYVSDSEFAIWAVKPKAKWTFNRDKSKPYLRAEFKTSVVSGKEKNGHPTQKSLKLMTEIIKIHTNIGDFVFDPFMGSGTTGAAAINSGRKFIGIEKEKIFFDLSLKRLKDANSKKEQ